MTELIHLSIRDICEIYLERKYSGGFAEDYEITKNRFIGQQEQEIDLFNILPQGYKIFTGFYFSEEPGKAVYFDDPENARNFDLDTKDRELEWICAAFHEVGHAVKPHNFHGDRSSTIDRFDTLNQPPSYHDSIDVLTCEMNAWSVALDLFKQLDTTQCRMPDVTRHIMTKGLGTYIKLALDPKKLTLLPERKRAEYEVYVKEFCQKWLDKILPGTKLEV